MPVGNVDLIDYLRNRKPSGKNAEADIEGAAAIDHRIYWVASHALKGKEGEADPHRRRFFATDIVAGGEPPTVKAVAGAPTNRCSTSCWPIRAFRCWLKPPGASPSKRAA